MSRLFSQLNTFVEGMNTDVSGSLMKPTQYRRAVNMFLRDIEGRMYEPTLIPNPYEIPNITLPENHKWHSAFQVRAKTVANLLGQQSISFQDAIILFSQHESNTQGSIHLFFPTGNVFFTIYSDANAPGDNDRAVTLDLGTEIDLFYIQDGDRVYAYWTDGKNPIRYIELVVDALNPATSQMYIPNEADLLYVQRLNPVTQLSLSVNQSGGALFSGSYSFAYRYYNSETRKYSKFCFLTNPISIIPTLSQGLATNEISGGKVGQVTGKSITVSLNGTHRHKQYYNTMQLAVVKYVNGLNGEPEISLLRPSEEFYQDGQYVYTGQDNESTLLLGDIITEESDFESCKTIQEYNGRIFIGNLKFKNLDFNLSPGTTANTGIQTFNINSDPLIANNIDTQIGYVDENDTYNYRGYFRGEVYRFVQVYGDKFGNYSAKAIDFSSVEKYDSGDHANTWQYNHAITGTDFKFLSRQSREGCIMSPDENLARVAYLNVGGITEHPSWAYDLGIFRMRRKKNILGQTPVVHGVAVQGEGYATGYDDLTEVGGTEAFIGQYWKNPVAYDYDGSLDTFLPKVLAYGHAKHLNLAYLTMGEQNVTHMNHYLGYEMFGTKRYTEQGTQYQPSGLIVSAGAPVKPKRISNLLWLYPLEYMANQDGTSISEVTLNGQEKLEVIDCVMLTGFNAYRDTEQPDESKGIGFLNGGRNNYAWVFAPTKGTAYFYANGHEPGILLKPQTDISPVNPVINVAPSSVNIRGGYTIALGAPVQPLEDIHSNGYGMEHISKLNGLYDLAFKQAENPNGLWDDVDTRAPFPDISQRALVVYTDMDERGTDNDLGIIYDPTWFIHNHSIANSDISFGSLFAGIDGIHPNAVKETYKATAATDAERQKVYDEGSINPVIAPGTSVPFYIANITRGLSDDRYGPLESIQTAYFTGAHTAISASDIQSKTAKSFNVYGGDCYITRLIAKIRDNAPRKIQVDTNDTDESFHWDYTVGDKLFGDSKRILTTYERFVEVIDMYVESEVNGYYVHNSGGYPSGFTRRDAGNEVPFAQQSLGFPEYSYPENSISLLNRPFEYQYNYGYSQEGEHSKVTRDRFQRVDLTRGDIVAFSNQKVEGSLLDFDFFNVADFASDPSSNVTKIARASNNRLWVVCEDEVGMYYLGRIRTADQDGGEISLQTGQVLGYYQVLSIGDDNVGKSGAQMAKAVINSEDGLFIFDGKRKAIFRMGEGLRDISHGVVEKELRENIFSKSIAVIPDFCFWYDQEKDQVGVYRSEASEVIYGQGLTYLSKSQVFESALEFLGIELKAVISSGGKTYFIVNNATFGEGGSIYEMYTSDEYNDHFGSPSKGSLEYVINGEGNAQLHKRPVSIVIDATDSPTDIQMSSDEDGANSWSIQGIPINGLRLNSYIANKIRYNGKKVVGTIINVIVSVNAPENKFSIRNITSSFRLKHRQNANR